MLEAEALERVREQVRQLLRPCGGEDLRGGVSLAVELGGELLEDDRRPGTVVHDRAVEVEDDDGNWLTGDRLRPLHHPREEGVLLGGRNASVRGAHGKRR